MGIGAQTPRAPGFVYYNPRFFQFSGHFSTSQGPSRFFVPDLRKVPRGAWGSPMGTQTSVSFPDLPSLGSFGTTLGRPTRASRRHHLNLPGHECAFRGPPTTSGSTPWAQVH